MNTLPSDPHAMHRRDLLARVASVAAGVAFAPALALAARRAHESFHEWAEVRPGVFATTDATTGGNCLAVAGALGSILVDTKYPVFARQLRRDAEALTGAPLRRIINTHHHQDHTGGNLEFVRTLPVIAHDRVPDRVRRQFDRHREGITRAARQGARVPEAFREQIADDLRRYTEKIDDYNENSWAPNTTVSAGRTGLDLGGRWIELIHFDRPAHTDNDLVVRLPAENVVHTGDLVFNGLHPFFDRDGGGASRGWIETLHAVLSLCDDQTIVVPGHGPVTDAQGVRAALAYIENLRNAVNAEIEAGTPTDELKAKTWPFMEGLGFETVRERAILFVHDELLAERG